MAVREPTLTKDQHEAFEAWFLSYFPDSPPTEADMNGKWWALEGFEYGLLHDRRKTRRIDVDGKPPVYQRPKVWFSARESTPGTPRIAIRQFREVEYLTLAHLADYLDAIKLAREDADRYVATQPQIKLVAINSLRENDRFEVNNGDVYEAAAAPRVVPAAPWSRRVQITVKHKKKGPTTLFAPVGQPVRLLHRPETGG